MSTRTKLRKERRENLRREVKEEMRQRYLQQTARTRKTFGIIGIALGSMVLLIGLWFGGATIIKKLNPVVSGPFGSIKLAELKKDKFALLETTKGNIKIELNAEETPNTAANFVLLAKKNFYDGVKFHRVVKDSNGGSQFQRC
jgi:hypothetical protein